jgi:hypothetical protein
MLTLHKLPPLLHQALHISALLLVVSFCSVSFAVSEPQPEPAPIPAVTNADLVPYQVECSDNGSSCKVDKATYIGWRTYHAVCHVCHAQDAVGSSFAPNLLERMQGMDKEKYLDVVLNGFTGQIGVMPGWKNDPNVLPRVDDLWSYLKARSDGVLGTGKPKRLP